MMLKCEHFGATVLWTDGEFSVGRCDGGCKMLLISRRLFGRADLTFTRMATKDEAMLIMWALAAEAAGAEAAQAEAKKEMGNHDQDNSKA